MATFHATPYDTSADFFYFTDLEDFEKKSKALRNAFGQPVEEFEIGITDGDEWEVELASHGGISQANLEEFFQVIDTFTDEREQAGALAYLSNEHGTYQDLLGMCPNELSDRVFMELGTEYYTDEQMHDEVGRYLMEETGTLDAIPEDLRGYFDFETYGRDAVLNGAMFKDTFLGTTYVLCTP